MLLYPRLGRVKNIFRDLTLLYRKAKIGALIKKNGGKHSTKISGEGEGWWVTHLVTTAKHIETLAEKGEAISCLTK